MAVLSDGKLVILSAPSGAGKTTIMKRVVKTFPQLEFSVSATSRPPRAGETDGRDYYFMKPDEFIKAAAEGRFVEWEEVYGGTYYGTLKNEIRRIWSKGKTIIFDVDVKGGIRLKELFGERALAVFIMPPSVAALEERLALRGTDPPEKITERLEKAVMEMEHADRFDIIVVNDDLDAAVTEVEDAIGKFISAAK